MNTRLALLLALSAVVGARAAEVNKCVDAAGRVSYQQRPCAPDSRSELLEFATATPQPARPARSAVAAPEIRVRLESAALHFEPLARGSAFRLSLAPRWINPGDQRLRVRYRVRLYDEADTELAVYSRFVDLDPQLTSRAPKLLATLGAGAAAAFDASQVARVSVAYSVAGAERVLDGVRIVRPPGP